MIDGPTQMYRVVVTGRQLRDSVDIRACITETFKVPEAQVNALLSGKALMIKKNVTATLAMQYKKALTQCGLECLAEPMDEESIVVAKELEQVEEDPPRGDIEAPEHRSSKAPDRSPADQADGDHTDHEDPASPGFRLAPVGARIGPRPQVAHVQIPDVSHLSAAQAERLSEARQGGPPPPSVDHLDIAPVGVTLGEVVEVRPLDIDLSHLSLEPAPEVEPDEPTESEG